MEKNLILDVNENPKKISHWILFAFQHILAMLVACITVPLLTGLPVGPTLIGAGVGTIIYVIVTKGKSPVFLSSSFAYISPMLCGLSIGYTAEQLEELGGVGQNYLAVILGMILVGLIYVVVAIIIKYTGTKWLNKLLPPVVIGPVIMVIGLGLAGSAITNVNSVAVEGGSSYMSLIIALEAVVITAVAAHYGKGTISLIPFVLGMGGAYVTALILTLIGNATNVDFLKVIDLSMFKQVDWSTLEAYINYDFMFVKAAQNNTFEPSQLGSIAIIFAPVAFVTICEHIGDHKNLGNIIQKDLINDEPGLTRTLIGDGVATAVSGVICGAANTTYGENVAVIGVSKIASVSVIFLAALISIVLGFFAPLTLVLETVPSCITGGVSLILYGFIASSGVKMLIQEKIDFSKTKNMMVASIILVSGIGGLSISFSFGTFSATLTSTALSMILGIIFNSILKDKEEKHLE